MRGTGKPPTKSPHSKVLREVKRMSFILNMAPRDGLELPTGWLTAGSVEEGSYTNQPLASLAILDSYLNRRYFQATPGQTGTNLVHSRLA